MLKRLAVNTASSFGFRLFSMALGFISVPILVDAIGADGYGIVLLALSVMGYFGILNAGVPAGTVKFVAEYEAKGDYETVNKIIASSITFFLGAGALVASGVAVFALLGGVRLFQIEESQIAAARHVLLIAAGIALFEWPLGTLSQVLDGLQRYPENRLAMGMASVLNKGGAIIAALMGASIEVVFLCMSVGILVAAPMQYRVIRKALPTFRLRLGDFELGTLRMIFGYSFWMLLNKISTLLVYQTDRVILGIFLPVSSLTIYHVITMPFTYIRDFSSMYNSAITPAVSSSEAQQGRKGLDVFLYTMSRYSNAFVAPLAIVGAILSGPFIGLWMGPEFVEYAWIAQMACLFQLWWQANSTMGRVFYGSGKVKRITVLAVVLAIINVPLGIWWVQTIGIAGVVFSTIATGVMAVPLQYLLVMPELDIDRARYFKESVVRGQWTSWLIGLLILPFWPLTQRIDSWALLALAGAVMAVVFYAAVWFATIEPRHRASLRRMLPSRSAA